MRVTPKAKIHDSSVSLAIYSPRLDVAKVTALVGCRPTRAHAKGHLRRPPHGDGPAPIGLWFLEAPKSLSFEDKIQYLLDRTTSRIATWRRLARGHDVQLRCGIFLHAGCEGFVLPAPMTAAIGARRWKLGVEVFGAEGEEIVDALFRKRRR